MSSYGLTDDVRALRERMKKFINEEVILAEPILMRENEDAHNVLDDLKRSAKQQGLWALGHPVEIGGGGVPFMSFVYLNEIIGRSHWGQAAVGSLSMQDSIMLHLYGTKEQKDRWLKPLVAGEILPSVGLTEPEVAGSDPTLMQSTAVLHGDEARVEIALIKFWGARMLHNVIDRAIQVHGALGVTADTPLEFHVPRSTLCAHL